MMEAEIELAIKTVLSEKLDISIVSFRAEAVGGGSINDSFRIVINESQSFFCKTNSIQKFPGLFEKEKSGIEFLGIQNIIRVPIVIGCERTSRHQVIIMEWIDQGLKSEKFWERFGEQLAALHFITHSFFGLAEDNYMGALSQSNKPNDSWVNFFVAERLIPQVTLARENKLLDSSHAAQFENLYHKLPNIFEVEQPSLLHGDLWSGNFLADTSGNPVLIDPAVYFGHRSMDLGMTTLFGGFDKSFYEAYRHHFPFPKNYYEQWDICNLYPLLIHLNLFGRSYLNDIVRTINKY